MSTIIIVIMIITSSSSYGGSEAMAETGGMRRGEQVVSLRGSCNQSEGVVKGAFALWIRIHSLARNLLSYTDQLHHSSSAQLQAGKKPLSSLPTSTSSSSINYTFTRSISSPFTFFYLSLPLLTHLYIIGLYSSVFTRVSLGIRARVGSLEKIPQVGSP